MLMNRMKHVQGGVFCFLLAFFFASCGTTEKSSFLLIDKESMTLGVYGKSGKLLEKYPIACGENYGNKEKEGDKKTPEWVFYISSIEDATDWDHDFKDGKGVIKHCYGDYFFRLETGRHKGIGIHGTHLPESIGTRASEGCIRLKNEDLLNLRKKVRVNLPVIITPSLEDMKVSRGIIEIEK